MSKQTFSRAGLETRNTRMKHRICAGILALTLVGCGGGSSTSNTSSNQVTSGAAVLRVSSGGTDVVVAVSSEALDEMINAGSDRGIAALVLGGSGFLVPQGTRVSVIGSAGFAKKKIVITSGEMVGRTGFVPMEWVVVQ